MSRWVRRSAVLVGVAGVALAARTTVLAPEPIPVRAVTVAAGTVEQTVTNSRAGTVKARRRAKLSPEAGGTVVALPHPEGDRVRRGDVLLRLDDVLPRARVELARRDLATARAQREQACQGAERAAREAERMERLAGERIVSADLLDQSQSLSHTSRAGCEAAEAVVARAGAAVTLAVAELDKMTLRAPFDGVVAELSIEVGEWTTPSPPAIPVPAVIDLIDPGSIYVSAAMDEVDSARVRPGLAARVSVDSHPGRSFPGRVVRVAPYVLDRVEQNRTVEIDVELDDQVVAATLLPGTSADAEVILDTRQDVLRLPTSALLEGGKVLVVEGGRLVERVVQVGVRNWDYAEIQGGLARGGTVVTSLDRADVKAGARVRVAEPAAAP